MKSKRIWIKKPMNLANVIKKSVLKANGNKGFLREGMGSVTVYHFGFRNIQFHSMLLLFQHLFDFVKRSISMGQGYKPLTMYEYRVPLLQR
jgi:hypothetical protein